MTRQTALILLAPAVLVLVALLVAPLAWLFRTSLYVGEAGMPPAGGMTLANYAKLFGDTYYLGILLKTFLISLGVTLLTALAAYPLAHLMWRASPGRRGVLTVVVLSPLLVSIVVSSFGWIVILGNGGLINQALMGLGLTAAPVKIMFTDAAIVIGLTHILLPFMTLSILSAMDRIDPVLMEAAATLGAAPWAAIRHIALPLSLPGIAAGTTIVFSLAVSAYVTPAVLGGSGANFITTLIHQQFVALFNWPFGASIAMLLLVVALGVVFVYLRILSRYGGPAMQAAARG
jgi:putative spermidine/putrescine transport system permease protein